MAQQNRNQQCKGSKDDEIHQNLWPIPLLILPIFSTPKSSLPFCSGKDIFRKCCSKEMGDFPSAWGTMIKFWGRVLLGGMSKNEQT